MAFAAPARARDRGIKRGIPTIFAPGGVISTSCDADGDRGQASVDGDSIHNAALTRCPARSILNASRITWQSLQSAYGPVRFYVPLVDSPATTAPRPPTIIAAPLFADYAERTRRQQGVRRVDATSTMRRSRIRWPTRCARPGRGMRGWDPADPEDVARSSRSSSSLHTSARHPCRRFKHRCRSWRAGRDAGTGRSKTDSVATGTSGRRAHLRCKTKL
jgi:hypothetical protein